MKVAEGKHPRRMHRDPLSPAFTVIGASLGCRQATRTHDCKSLSSLPRLQVLLRAREIPDPILSKRWQAAMHLCEFAEGQRMTLKAVSCSELSWGDNVTRDALLQEGLDHLMHFFEAW